MIKTFQGLLEVDSLVGGLYTKNPELKESKFGYAYTKFYEKNITPTLKEYKEVLEDARIFHAMEDDKGRIVIDPNTIRGYAYSKEGLQALLKKEREAEAKYHDTEIEIKPYFSTYIPDYLTAEQKEALTGLVIEPYVI